MISVEKLCFTYAGSDARFALRDISFSLKPGERVALMGANGSGKTTFIRCLNGLVKPHSGSILVDGISVQNTRRLHEIRRRVGMVFQNPDHQIVTTTVEREVAFGLENLGVTVSEMRERVGETLKVFQLEAYRHRPPHLLSGGERQRLAFASVWVMRPAYLILDEPTSLLDPRGRGTVLRLLEDRFGAGRPGILFVTQFPDEALGFDRLVVMDRGRIVLDDFPERVFRHAGRLRKMGLDVPVESELGVYL
jgi:energy-coupling factor transporter ATPase